MGTIVREDADLRKMGIVKPNPWCYPFPAHLSQEEYPFQFTWCGLVCFVVTTFLIWSSFACSSAIIPQHPLSLWSFSEPRGHLLRCYATLLASLLSKPRGSATFPVRLEAIRPSSYYTLLVHSLDAYTCIIGGSNNNSYFSRIDRANNIFSSYSE